MFSSMDRERSQNLSAVVNKYETTNFINNVRSIPLIIRIARSVSRSGQLDFSGLLAPFAPYCPQKFQGIVMPRSFRKQHKPEVLSVYKPSRPSGVWIARNLGY